MITQFEKDILKKIEKGEKRMKKIIVKYSDSWLSKGQEVFEFQDAQKKMNWKEKKHWSQFTNRWYYGFNGYSWLSIPKDECAVIDIPDVSDVVAPSEAQVKTKNLNEILDDTAQTKPNFKVGDRVMLKDDYEKEIFEIESVSILYELKGNKFPLLDEEFLILAPKTQRYFNVYKWIEDSIKRGRDAKYVESLFDVMMKNHGKLAKDGAQNYPEWCDEK